MHLCCFVFLFIATSPPHTYPLSLHDALPIYLSYVWIYGPGTSSYKTKEDGTGPYTLGTWKRGSSLSLERWSGRSEEHTSELQSRPHLVCRLLLEKKKKTDREPTRAHTQSSAK